MPHLSRTLQLFIGSTVAFVLFVAGYFFMYTHITFLQTNLHEQKAEVAALEAQIQKKHTIEELLSSSEKQRSEIAKLYVPLADPTELLELIELCAKEAKVLLEVESIKLGENQDPTSTLSTKDVSISLVVGGRWNELYHLLYLLEHLPYTISISTANLSISQNEGVGHWKGNILLKGEAL